MADKTIDDLLNFINQDDDTAKKKKKKKNKKGKKDSSNDNNTNENKEDEKEKEKEMEEPKSEEQNKPEELKEDSNSKSLNKKEEKQKKLFLKYLPNNINTDKENESCSQKQEPRENKYRELITPGSDITISNKRFQDNSHLRLIGNWEEGDTKQTNPPTKSIDEQYNCLDEFPTGVIMDYAPNNIWRSTSEEKKELERYFKYKIESM